MRTRRLMAAAVLAALPLVVGTLHASPPRSTDVTASALYALGVSWNTAWAIGEAIGCGWSSFDIAM